MKWKGGYPIIPDSVGGDGQDKGNKKRQEVLDGCGNTGGRGWLDRGCMGNGIHTRSGETQRRVNSQHPINQSRVMQCPWRWMASYIYTMSRVISYHTAATVHSTLHIHLVQLTGLLQHRVLCRLIMNTNKCSWMDGWTHPVPLLDNHPVNCKGG